METSTPTPASETPDSSYGASSPQELRGFFLSIRENMREKKGLEPFNLRRWKLLKEEEKAMWDCLFQMWNEVQTLKGVPAPAPSPSSKRASSGKRSDG